MRLPCFVTGIGHIYGGDLTRGILFLIVHSILIILGFGLLLSPQGSVFGGILCFLATFPVWIGSVWDAYHTVKRKNTSNFEASRKGTKDPWRAVFLSRVFFGLGHLYLGKLAIGSILLFMGILSWIIPVIYPPISPAISILAFVAVPFILYHVYTIAPVRRETGKKLIIVFGIAALLAPILFSILPALTIRSFIAEARYIPSGTMEPTLQINDRLIIDKLHYRFGGAPQRGDIVVFRPTEALIQEGYGEVFIKRVIGLPTETVKVQNETVYINNQPLQENYLAAKPTYEWGPETVPEGHYFVLGDNRNNSFDSHYWGFVPHGHIIGKATKIYWPMERIGNSDL